MLSTLCPQGDNTPLHWASMRGHVEIVRLLCERSADRSIRNKQDKVWSFGGLLLLLKLLPVCFPSGLQHDYSLVSALIAFIHPEQVPVDLAQPCWSHSYRYTREVLAN